MNISQITDGVFKNWWLADDEQNNHAIMPNKEGAIKEYEQSLRQQKPMS